MAVEKTNFHSYCSGKLHKGCELCVQGKKLFCSLQAGVRSVCFYCPINEKKYGQDVVYANEWKIEDPKDPKELRRSPAHKGLRRGHHRRRSFDGSRSLRRLHNVVEEGIRQEVSHPSVHSFEARQ